MLKESGSDLVTIGERLADKNIQLECLGVNIANINATLASEEDRVTLTFRCDADVIFGSCTPSCDGLTTEITVKTILLSYAMYLVTSIRRIFGTHIGGANKRGCTVSQSRRQGSINK